MRVCSATSARPHNRASLAPRLIADYSEEKGAVAGGGSEDNKEGEETLFIIEPVEESGRSRGPEGRRRRSDAVVARGTRRRCGHTAG